MWAEPPLMCSHLYTTSISTLLSIFPPVQINSTEFHFTLTSLQEYHILQAMQTLHYRSKEQNKNTCLAACSGLLNKPHPIYQPEHREIRSVWAVKREREIENGLDLFCLKAPVHGSRKKYAAIPCSNVFNNIKCFVPKHIS